MPTLFSHSLATFCLGLEPDKFSAELVEKLRAAVLDGIASMLAGVGEPVSAQVCDAVAGDARNRPGEGGCTVVGFGHRIGLRDAALVNGTIAHACDYDDSSFTMWGHPTAPVLPAVLACAEYRRQSGAALLAAVAAGVEVEKVMGLVMQPEHYRRGWHPTATLGLFGAVGGAGRLLGLTAAQLKTAFGIAASMAAGLRANAGYGAKPVHAGLAARGGVEAALLAQAGVTSNPLALDGEDGLFALYGASRATSVEVALDRLGRPFEVIDPGLSPKLYPCCSDIHCAIDIVLDEKSRHGFSASEVAAIRCFVAPMAEPNVRRRDPATPVEAKFSMSYCVGAAVVLGRVGLTQFTAEALANAAVRAVAERVTVAADAALAPPGTETFSSPARVEIELADGRRFDATLREMRGHPRRPLTNEEMRRKFFECTEAVCGAAGSAQLHGELTRLETLPDVLELMRLAGGARPLAVATGVNPEAE